tara:strand:+ start:274 stop:501 length:228 start_codon:yes stop_codon:yes gene_type:complete
MNIKTTDPIVLKVIAMLDSRSAVGLEKYGISLQEDNRQFSEWCTMAIEEALDKANYLMKIKEEWENMNVNNKPNK